MNILDMSHSQNKWLERSGCINMVLKPLEFEDSLTDSPWFRQQLLQHEQSADRAYKHIKHIEQDCRDLIAAAQKLSAAHRKFARSLSQFQLDTSVNETQTDEERVIANCLNEFSRVIERVEDQRDGILAEAERLYIEPLKTFRCERIGRALTDDKKKFEKASGKYYQSLEKHLGLSTGKGKNANKDFSEADAALHLERRHFYKASLDYVYILQAIQERMRFEFVKTLSSFLYGWLSFYHVGHVIHEDFKPYLDLVQLNIEKAKENFDISELEAEELKLKMLNARTQGNKQTQQGETPQPSTSHASSIRQGYLFVLEKKNIGPSTWTKYYCVYQRESRIFTMIPHTAAAKQDMRGTFAHSVSMKLKSCTRRASDTIDKRFCFDIVTDRSSEALTVQALSEDDRRLWLEAMDAHEPLYSPGSAPQKPLQTLLDNTGIDFISLCLKAVENTSAIDEQGVYRNCGVNSKVQKLLQIGLDEQKQSQLNLFDEKEWEARTVTSAVKTYLRSLPEPVMTYDLHAKFINAAKMDLQSERVRHIHYYVYQLPGDRFRILEMIIKHLNRVTQHCGSNLMTVSNLGVCFGPTLLRPKEETLAAIMHIKFCNVVVELLIANCDEIFSSRPPPTVDAPKPPKPEKSSDTLCTDVSGLLPYSPQPQCTRSVEQLNGSCSERTPASNSIHLQHQPQQQQQQQRQPLAVHTGSSDVLNSRHNKHHAKPTSIFYEMNASSTQSIGPNQSASSSNLLGVNGAPPPQQPISSSCDSLTSGGSAAGHTNSESSPSPNRLANSHSNGSKGRMSISYAPPYQSDILCTLQGVASPFAAQYLNAPILVQPRRVRTLYDCTAGHESELSFLPGQIITNVYQSKEPGWLVGSLNGRTGLIPANYVEPLP